MPQPVRLAVILAALATSTFVRPVVRAAGAAWQTDGLDHLMLWTDNIDRTTAVMTVKLGFQVRPGGDFGDGVANRLLRLGDDSYLELLYTTRPRQALNTETRAALDALRAATGANTFAIHPLDLGEVERDLGTGGFALDPPSPLSYDPDGPGPLPAVPATWRTLGFTHPPLTAADLFFISYAAEQPTAQQLEDRELMRQHPNGSRAWTAIWLLSSDVAADTRALARMGFSEEGDVAVPQIGARGVRFHAGPDTILLLSPNGAGLAARALAKRGGHVLGVSIGVQDVERAQRLVAHGYGVAVERYVGLEGDSILAPTYDDLGLLIELHALRR